MATHDYVLANASGAAFRTDLNNALAAIVSNNSNSSSPSTTYAYQWWADTSAGVLKIRNSANNAWIELLQLDGTLTLEDGSASTPALSFRDDLNTGVYSSAADTFNVATGGVERMELGAATVFNEDGADVDFRIEGDNEANLFKIDAGNDRIGIGTATPQVLMHLHQNGARLQFTNTNTGSASGDGIIMGINGDNDFFINNQEDNEHILFFTEGTEVARFTDTKKFLVGTSTSSTVGNSQYSKFEVSGNTSSATGAAHITIKAGTTTASQTNGNTLGRLVFSTLDGGDYAYIQASIDGAMGSSDFPGRMMFFTCADNASTATERMRISADGTVNIYNKLDLGAGGPASRIDPVSTAGCLFLEADPAGNYGTSNIRFHVDNGEIMRVQRGTNPFVAIGRTNQQGSEGLTVERNGQDVVFFTQASSGNYKTLRLLNKRATTSTTGRQIEFLDTSGNTRGSIENNTSTTTYNTSSDYRLKENEVEISDGIDRLKQLKPYRFNWKNRPNLTVDGFFAHEAENIVEDCVSGEKDGEEYQQMDHSKLVPLLVAAVKQLITKVETLEAA